MQRLSAPRPRSHQQQRPSPPVQEQASCNNDKTTIANGNRGPVLPRGRSAPATFFQKNDTPTAMTATTDTTTTLKRGQTKKKSHSHVVSNRDAVKGTKKDDEEIMRQLKDDAAATEHVFSSSSSASLSKFTINSTTARTEIDNNRNSTLKSLPPTSEGVQHTSSFTSNNSRSTKKSIRQKRRANLQREAIRANIKDVKQAVLLTAQLAQLGYIMPTQNDENVHDIDHCLALELFTLGVSGVSDNYHYRDVVDKKGNNNNYNKKVMKNFERFFSKKHDNIDYALPSIYEHDGEDEHDETINVDGNAATNITSTTIIPHDKKKEKQIVRPSKSKIFYFNFWYPFTRTRRRRSSSSSTNKSRKSHNSNNKMSTGSIISSSSSSTSATTRRRRRTKKQQKHDLLAAAPWMCSFCGNVFATCNDANTHEKKCIRQACNIHNFFGEKDNTASTTAIATTDSNCSSNSSRSNSDDTCMSLQHGEENSRFCNNEATALTLASQNNKDQQQQQQEGEGNKISSTQRPSSSGHHHGRRRNKMIPLSNNMRAMIRMTDDTVGKVVTLANTFMITNYEKDAELELALYARDRSYYDHMERRALLRHGLLATGRRRRNTKLKQHKDNALLTTIQNKLSDAYTLVKGRGEEKSKVLDAYNSASKTLWGNIVHSDSTLFVNVLVKNSAHVVSSELQRLAKLRWNAQHDATDPDNQFAHFRARAQQTLVKLASMALESDFKPRRISVKMSNDFYRLLGPELKRRGIKIELEIEYRVGAFFVLAVNILAIDWMRYIQHISYDTTRRALSEKRRVQLENESNREVEASSDDHVQAEKKEKQKSKNAAKKKFRILRYFNVARLFPSLYDMMAFCFAFLYHFHWIISHPFCSIWYFLFPRTTHMFICQSIVDDLYRYAENKGMEMDMSVESTFNQAAFMLNVLRKMRADERKQNKGAETEGDDEDKPLLGELLGPHVKEDKAAATQPDGFELPECLENSCLQIDVPVGYRRLRWALLKSDSEFMKNAIMSVEERYENIKVDAWSVHDDQIGLARSDIDYATFIGAEREQRYLIPANAMVKANTAIEMMAITEYNDYCFAYKSQTRTPEVPFGGSFCTWTQVVVYDLGKENCRLICSSGAEFPNGRPMVARQIESGIRSGTTEAFVRLGETICRYA